MRVLRNLFILAFEIIIIPASGWAQSASTNQTAGSAVIAMATVLHPDGTPLNPIRNGNVFTSMPIIPGEKVTIQLPSALLLDQQPALIDAEDGGTITIGNQSGRYVNLQSVSAAVGLTFQFQPLQTSDRYHVSVTQGGQTAMFEFLVGPLPAATQASPASTDAQ